MSSLKRERIRSRCSEPLARKRWAGASRARAAGDGARVVHPGELDAARLAEQAQRDALLGYWPALYLARAEELEALDQIREPRAQWLQRVLSKKVASKQVRSSFIEKSRETTCLPPLQLEKDT